jgi:hypothetical protein
MWYRNGKDGERYFLKELNQEVHGDFLSLKSLDLVTKIRDLRPSDTLINTLRVYYFTDGTSMLFTTYEATKDKVTVVKYPEYPTFESLHKEFKSNKSTVLKDNVYAIFEERWYLITVGNRHVFKFYPGGITFLNTGFVLPDEIFKTYLGKTLEYDNCQVRFPGGKTWYKIITNLTLDLSVKDIHLGLKDTYKFTTQTFDRVTANIDEYLALITEDYLLKSFSWLDNKKAVLQSRCRGCRERDKSHVIVHMKRRELPFIILLSAINMYWVGKGAPEYIIEELKTNSKLLPLIKNALRKFLEECLLPVDIMRRKNTPRESIYGVWQHTNTLFKIQEGEGFSFTMPPPTQVPQPAGNVIVAPEHFVGVTGAGEPLDEPMELLFENDIVELDIDEEDDGG